METRKRIGKQGKIAAIGLVAVAVVVLCAVLLCSCAPKQDQIVGTWVSESGVYLSNYGTSAKKVILFYDSGKCVSVLLQTTTDKVLSYDTGVWLIDGKEVKLYMDSDYSGAATVYEYKSKKLSSGSWTLTKTDESYSF